MSDGQSLKQIIILDNTFRLAEEFIDQVKHAQCNYWIMKSLAECKMLLEVFTPDILLFPVMEGIMRPPAPLDEFRKQFPNCHVYCLVKDGDSGSLAEGMRLGAQASIQWPSPAEEILKKFHQAQVLQETPPPLPDNGSEAFMSKIHVNINQDLEEIVPMYLRNVTRDIESLDSFLKQEDYDNIEKITHKIKGNAGSYGFMDLTHLAGKVEDHCINNDYKEIAPLIAQMKNYITNVEITYTEED